MNDKLREALEVLEAVIPLVRGLYSPQNIALNRRIFALQVNLREALAASKQEPQAQPAAVTAEHIQEVNDSLWAELDEIKEKTGYNAYREANRGLIHWTLTGYLIDLKRRAEAPAAVPDGYVLVPGEPTREMIKAGARCASSNMCWREMLAAAPNPQDDLPAILKKQAS